MELRPYQERFVTDLRAAYAGGARSVLGVSPTGSGKTVMFSYMAREAVNRGLRVGIVAHRVEILDQISATLAQWGVDHGMIAPGRMPDPLARVQVCSVQTIARRIERYRDRPFDLLIVDEAHHAASGTAWASVIGVHASKRVLGVTATPERLSGEPLDVFQSMVIGPTTRELIDMGALCEYRAFAPAMPDLSDVKRRMGDYIKDELATAMDKPSITGDAVKEYRRRCMGKRAVAFCVSIAHAEHVAATFHASGIASEHIDGKMDRKDRREAIARFKAGQTLVLTSADLISEGFDLPAIEAAILLRPTQSLALYLQQVGRSLRTFAGKDRAIILDHAGNIARHGLPDDDRQWSLEGKVKRKSGPTESTIPTSTCEKCFFIGRPFTVCPSCGHERETMARKIEEVAGDLEEVNADLVRRARQIEQARAKSYEELVQLGRSRGYQKPEAWARHMVEARARKRA